MPGTGPADRTRPTGPQRVRETEFANLPPTLDYSRTPEADGSWRFQLYELMAIFGPSLPTYASSSQEHLVFVNNAIVFLGSSQTQRAGYAGVRTGRWRRLLR